jgi:hypothetical protein
MGAQISTAGAYVLLDGRFVFMVGPTPRGDGLAVVRLGGHPEAGETAWECAAREVHEEASLRIHPIAPPDTYWFQVGCESETLQPGPPSDAALGDDALGEVAPLLVVRGARPQTDQVSVMYLASAAGPAAPAAEAHGLLLLRPTEVVRLVCTEVTLDQFRQAGGLAIPRTELPGHLPLEAYLQLRLLAVLLLRHPELNSGQPEAPANVADRYRA